MSSCVAVASVLALASVGASCATVHEPARDGRIGLIVRGGGLSYVKNGVAAPIGPLGGDLAALVADDGDAVRFARRARRELAVGVPSYVCGIAAVVVGVLIRKPAGWAVAGGGAALAGVGIGLMGAGVVNDLDAVNLYNDRAPP